MAQRTALRVAALLGALSVVVAGCGAAGNTTAPGAQGPTSGGPSVSISCGTEPTRSEAAFSI